MFQFELLSVTCEVNCEPGKGGVQQLQAVETMGRCSCGRILPYSLSGQSLAGCGSPITLVPAGRFAGERHFNEAGFEDGLQIDRGEVVSVSELQRRLYFGATHFSGEDGHQLLDLLSNWWGDLVGTLVGDLVGTL